MADDALIRALLSGGRGLSASSLLQAGSTPQPQGTFGDIAQALVMVPEILKARQKEEADRRHLERKRDLELLSSEQGLEKGKREIEGLDREAALADVDRRKSEFLSGFGDVEGKLKAAEEAKALDPDSISALDAENLDIDRMNAEARQTTANRPSGQGSLASLRVLGVDERGRTVVWNPDTRRNELANGEPVTGPVFKSDATKTDRQQLGTLAQVGSALDTIDRRFDAMDNTTWLDFVQKSDQIIRLQSAVEAISTPLGRALGEGRITDQDRRVYSALIGGGVTRQTLGQLGFSVESVRESVQKLRDTINDIENAIVEHNRFMSGAELGTPASELNAGTGRGGEPTFTDLDAQKFFERYKNKLVGGGS